MSSIQIIHKSLLDQRCQPVEPMEFYNDIFGDYFDEPEAYTKGGYTGIVIELKDNKTKRYNITNGLYELSSLINTSDGFCFMSPISYAGKRRTKDNARFLFAYAIDLDGLKVKDDDPVGLKNLLYQIDNKQQPCPTYIVNSGTGVHLYYVFEEPIPMYKKQVSILEQIRCQLVRRIWNDAVTSFYEENKIQMENLYQGFRVVGTNTKANDGTKCTAYKVGMGEKTTIDDIRSFLGLIGEEYNIKHKPKYTFQELKEKFPEWTARHFDENGNSLNNNTRGSYTVNRAVYDWWKKRITNEIFEGHRYYALLALTSYALKCGIEYDELSNDCYELLPIFNARTESKDNKFTSYDVKCALSAYKNNNLIFMSTYGIERISGLKIERNKRNHRKRHEHVVRMTALRDIDYPDGSWRNKKKDKLVIEWRTNNPGKTKMDCHKDTGISRTTIDKYWNKVDNINKEN